MHWFLSEMDRRFFEQRAERSFCSEDTRPWSIRLFNKNALSTLHVRIVAQCENRFGWIVECEDVPPYFKHVLREA
jgi:hypothetical protein